MNQTYLDLAKIKALVLIGWINPDEHSEKMKARVIELVQEIADRISSNDSSVPSAPTSRTVGSASHYASSVDSE
jgi:hypothetical protein